jgi:hypothetical protein
MGFIHGAFTLPGGTRSALMVVVSCSLCTALSSAASGPETGKKRQLSELSSCCFRSTAVS